MQLNLAVHNTRLNARAAYFNNHTLPIFWLDWVSKLWIVALMSALLCYLQSIYQFALIYAIISAVQVVFSSLSPSFITTIKM
jgi:hypothetical protein